MARIAVVFDQGSAAAEIAIGLDGLGDVLFLVPEATNRQVGSVLGHLGQLVVLTGEISEDLPRVRAHRPDAILTFCDHMLPVTTELAAGLDLPFHDAATLRVLTDKVAQRTRLRDSAVDALRFATVRTPAELGPVLDAAHFPAVAKPRTGAGSRHVYRLPDADSAKNIMRQAFTDTSGSVEFVIEDMLTGRPYSRFGDLISVESLVVGDSMTHLVTGKQPLVAPFRTCGAFVPSGLAEDELSSVRELTGNALRALGVRHGVTHTEIKLTPDGPRVIEVNGRLGGHVRELYLRATGVDLIEVAGRLALGDTVPGPLPEPAQVFFQYHNLAPIPPCRLAEVRNLSSALARAGITDYVQYVQPGEDLPGGVGTRRLDLIAGVAPNHEAMFEALDRVLDEVTFVFSFSGVPREIAAADLPAHAENELRKASHHYGTVHRRALVEF